MVRGVLILTCLVLLVAAAWFVVVAREAPPATTTAPEDAAARPCRVLLLGKTGKPLASRETFVSTLIAGSRSDHASGNTNAAGVVDFGAFRTTQDEVLRTHGDRVSWRLYVAEKEADVDLRACGERPISVTLPVRPLAIAGHFVNARGERVRKPADLFPPAVRPYLPQDHNFWSAQIRAYDEHNQLLANAVRVDAQGAFVVDADEHGPLRFELMGAAGYRLVSDRVEVTPRNEAAVKVEAKPHILFGDVRDAVDKSAVAENITVQTDEGTFTDVTRRGQYAVFFERPGKHRITVADFPCQNRYQAETVDVDIDGATQRRDFALQPIAAARGSLRVKIEIAGVEVTQPISLYVRGDEFTTNEYGAKNAFDIVVPRAGKYAIGFFSQFYAAEEKQVEIERHGTVRIDAREKRTRLLVRVVGPDRQPVRFPQVREIHEPPVNVVLLEDAKPPALRPHVYATSFIGDVQSALRPDGEGRVEFRLARGGNYRLVTDFEEFEPSERPIRLTTDETTEIELILVRRRTVPK